MQRINILPGDGSDVRDRVCSSPVRASTPAGFRMSLVSLTDLLAGARPHTHCVAIRNGQPITLRQLRADVSHNAVRLSTRSVRRAAVVCEDGYWFIVGVLALLKIGADV